MDAISGLVDLDPLQARQLEKTVGAEVDSQLSSFVISAVTEIPEKARSKNAET